MITFVKSHVLTFPSQTHSSQRLCLLKCASSERRNYRLQIYIYIFQISFASATSELSDRARFQYYFRTTPSFVNYAPSILGVLNKYKWKQIAFITQNHGSTFIKVCFVHLLQ